MSAVFVQAGQAVDFVPSRDVAAGEVLVCNGIAGVVKMRVRSGEAGDLHLSGVYDVDKLPVAMRPGEAVYWNSAWGVASSAASGNVFLGTACAASPEGARKVRVLLNFGHPECTGGSSSEGIEWRSV